MKMQVIIRNLRIVNIEKYDSFSIAHFYNSVLAMKFANCNEIKLKQDNVAKLMHQQDMISEIEGILKIP